MSNLRLLLKMAYIKNLICGIIDISMPERNKKIREYPDTIQLPITYKCNYDCIMCGMRNLVSKNDFTCNELEKILQDKLYSKITSIGINGGEPFLKNDLVECVEVMCKNIPSLKHLFFISNGYFSDLICEKLEKIKKITCKYGVSIDLALSIDGIAEMHNQMRGNADAWDHMMTTLTSLKKEKHYDSLGVICTITKLNVYNLYEVEEWAKANSICVNYNIATINRRIDNYSKYEDFTIFNDKKAEYMAEEFFYKKFHETLSKKYFAIYLYIKEKRRYAHCPCQVNSWVTLTPDSQLGYCATHSKNLGNVLENSSYELFQNSIDYLYEIKNKYCESCSHYIYGLNKEGKKLYYKEILRMLSY